MKKFAHEFMLVGLDGKISYSGCDLLELQGKEAKSFINGERSDCSREYFVETHGIRPVPKNFLQKTFNQPSEYLLTSPNGQIPAHKIIPKLIKNHPTYFARWTNS